MTNYSGRRIISVRSLRWPVFILCWALCGSRALPSDDTLAVARAGFRQARESIHSLHLFVDMDSGPTEEAENRGYGKVFGKSKLTAEWWLTPDKARWREVLPGQVLDNLWAGQEQKVVPLDVRDTKGRKMEPQGSIQLSAQPKAPTSPWSLAAWTTLSNSKQMIDEALENSRHVTSARTISSPEGNLIHIVLEPNRDTVLEFWLESTYNYLPRKQVFHNKSISRKREQEVISFREWKPGFFFPEKTESRIYTNDLLLVVNRVTFRDVKINESLPPNIFNLSFPVNMLVTDDVRGQSYKIGPRGQAVNPRPLPPKLAKTPSIVVDLQSPPKQRNPLYLIMASAAFAMVSVSILFWWRIYKRRVVHPTSNGSTS